MKAILASIVVIALALSAISGITYSWWSDTEQTDITIDTGYLDVSATNFKVTVGGVEKVSKEKVPSAFSISYGGTASADLALDMATVDPDNPQITISYDVEYKANIDVRYLLNVSIPTGITATTKVMSGVIDRTSILGTYQSDDSKTLDVTYSVSVSITKLEQGISDKLVFTNYITQSANPNALALSSEVSEQSATVEDASTKISVKATSLPESASKFNVAITTDDSEKKASIDLTLTNASGNKITEFDTSVVITTVLKGAYDGIYYNGNADQPTGVTYEWSVDGETFESTFADAKYTKITFSTNHFSEYVAYTDVLSVSDVDDLKVALNAGVSKIKILNDLDISEPIVVKSKTYLDMNGKKIYNTTDIYEKDAGETWNALIEIRGGNLTITGEGTFDAKEDDCYAVSVWEKGKCTVENGTFIGNIHAVYVHDGEAIIEDGSFSIKQLYPDKEKSYEFVLNCKDEYYKAGTAKITVEGGTFYNFNPQDCKAEGAETNFCADGYISYSETGETDTVWTVVQAAAKIGDIYYANLESAFAAAQDPTPATEGPVTIEVLRDSSGNGIKVESGSSIIVDFNGYTYLMNGKPVGSYKTESQAFQLLKDSTIVFKNGTLKTSTSPQYKMVIQNYSDLTLDGMTVDGSNLVEGCYTLSNNNGTVSIVNSTIIPPLNGVAFDVYGAFSTYVGPEVTVSGSSDIKGTIEVDIAKDKGTGTTQSLTIESGVTYEKVNVEGVLSGASLKIASDVYDSDKCSTPEGYGFVLQDGYYVLTPTNTA